MNKYKLAVTSLCLLVLGVLIGYGITKYNQSRYVIHNNQEKERKSVGYIYAYNQPDKESITSTSDAKGISNDSNRIGSTYQYMHYIYSTLAEESDPGKLVQLLNEIQKESIAERKYRASLAVIDKLGLIDPALALQQLQTMKLDRKEELIKGLFAVWSRIDMTSAVDKAIGLSGRLRDAASSSILKECMQLDSCDYPTVYETLNFDNSLSLFYVDAVESIGPKRLANLWRNATSNDYDVGSNRLYLKVLARKWVSESGLLALKEIDRSLSNPQIKYDILDSALQEYAREKPRESFEFALNLPASSEVNSLFFSILSSWVDINPIEAFTRVSTIEPPGRKRDFQQSILNFWTFDDPRSLLDYSESIPKQLRDTAQKQALNQIANEDPQTAIKLADQILSTEQLEQGLSRILLTWSSNDVTSALDWVLNHEEHSNNVEFLKTVIREYARYYPVKALQLTENMEITKKLAIQQMVVASIAETDALYARDLLSKMDPASYLVNAHAVIRGLVRQGFPLEAIALLDNSQLSKFQENSSISPIQNQFTYTVINEWLMIDPIDAYNNLPRITNEKIASKLAQRLIGNNRYEHNFEAAAIAEIQAYVLPEDETKVDKSELSQIPPNGEIMIMLRPQ